MNHLRDLAARIRAIRRRGSLSPDWTIPGQKFVLGVAALILVPVGVSYAVVDVSTTTQLDAAFGWLRQQPWAIWVAATSVALAVAVALMARDAKARLDLLQHFKSIRGRLPTSHDLRPEDVLRDNRVTDPITTFLPRDGTWEDSRETSLALDALTRHLEAPKARPLAIIAPAGMGKTRLVYEAMKCLPADTLVLLPRGHAQRPARTSGAFRYLRERRAAIFFDDLDLYTQDEPHDLVEAVRNAAGGAEVNVFTTVTRSRLTSVIADQAASTKRLFEQTRQLELHRMSAGQMSEIAKATDRELTGGDFGGNPGMLLANLDSLRSDFQALAPAERDVLRAVFALFAANIDPVTEPLTLAIVSGVFRRDYAAADLSDVLDRLQEISFLREREPIVPEEAYSVGVLGEDAATEHALALYQPLANGEFARELLQLGLHFWQLRGDLSSAEEMYRKALEINERLGRPEGMANAYGNLGNVMRTRGDLDGAEEMLRRALEINERLGRLEGIAQAYVNLGIVLFTRGDPDGAEETYRKALEINERLGRLEGVARNYGNLGNVLETRGDLDAAEEMHRKSLEIEERLGSLEGMASQYGNLGIVLTKRGDLDGAEEMLHKALEINERLEGAEGMANAYGNLGIVLETRGDLDGAEEMYRKALEINERLGRPEGMANAYGNLGNVLITRGDLDGAEEMLRKGLELAEQLGAARLVAQFRQVLDVLRAEASADEDT